MIARVFWNFWAKPIRGESLALFRILLALTILLSQLTGIGRVLSETCGPDGYCPIKTNDEWIASQGRSCLLRGPVGLPLLGDWLPTWLVEDHAWLGHLQNRVSPDTAQAWAAWGERLDSHYLLFGAFLLSLVCLALGLGTRLSALGAVLLAGTFHNRLPWLMNGGDSLFRNGLYFLLLSPAGCCWSLDRVIGRRLGRWLGWQVSDEPVMIAPWSVRLMQIQVCCMYFFTGVVKTGDSFFITGDKETWGDYVDGMALYWVMNDLAITRWSYAWLPLPVFVCRMMTWTTLTFELSFTFLVCIRPLRKWILLLGLALHLGILVVMEIGWFSQVTLCWYVLFVPGEKVSRFVEQAGVWLRGKPLEPAPVRLAA